MRLRSLTPADAFALPVIRRLGVGLLNAVLPPRCLSCGVITETTHALCAECWPRIRFITEPLCASCGMPFEFEVAPATLCAVCLAAERPFERARAAIAYDDGSRGLILAFKHGDRTDAARAFAPWMAKAGAELLATAELLVPVPLHWTRLLMRRYNQAALLAQAVGRIAEARFAPEVLVRRKRTPSLAHAGASERARTVGGAFVVPPKRREQVEGKRVLLVDDVFTTGSTVASCARALKRAGARSIDVLTLARVVRPSHLSHSISPTRSHWEPEERTS